MTNSHAVCNRYTQVLSNKAQVALSGFACFCINESTPDKPWIYSIWKTCVVENSFEGNLEVKLLCDDTAYNGWHLYRGDGDVQTGLSRLHK